MNLRGVMQAGATVLFCVLAAGRAHAQSIVLEIPGVQGESTVVGFANQIDISSLQLGAAKPCGSGSSLSVSEITVTKMTDKASVDLYSALRDHTVYPTATFRVLTGGIVNVSYQLTNAVVTAASISTGGTLPSESFSFSFSQVLITYTIVAGGKAGASESTTLVLGACPGP